MKFFAGQPWWQRPRIRVGRKAEPRTVLVTGATGFVGRNLCRHLLEQGDRIIVLTRRYARAWALYGPNAQIVTSLDEIAATQRIDAIVNLAGAPIMPHPWTKARRAQLLASRLDVTNAVVALIARLHHKPLVLVSASAVGYYGVRGDEEITEATRGQPIFQSHLCQTWELAAQAARQHGVRVCRVRLGLVLGREGGALPGLTLPARLGLRLVLGSGQQWISWIHIADLMALIDFCIANDDVSGGINACAPHPARQEEFATLLARRFVGSGLTLIAPAPCLRMAMGDMSQLLLDGQRVLPMQAACHGFEFRYRDAASALEQIWGRPQRRTARATTWARRLLH